MKHRRQAYRHRYLGLIARGRELFVQFRALWQRPQVAYAPAVRKTDPRQPQRHRTVI